MMMTFFVIHLVASEYILALPSKGEVLTFRQGSQTERKYNCKQRDVENTTSPFESSQKEIDNAVPIQGQSDEIPCAISQLANQVGCFHWVDIKFEVKTRRERVQVLRDVNGWVQPGTLTALMVS